jgi:hypothetical protein
MLVYRHPARELSGLAIQQELRASMRRLVRDPIGDFAIEALLRAGELECALADLGHPSEHPAAYVTDAMASHVLVDNGRSLQWVERSLASLELPNRLRLRTPSGFAHDGLDPRRYATLAPALTLRADAPVAVIGVRSIGTSLGAIVSEALRLRGHQVERTTVRPTGHPWARVLRMQPAEAAFVARMLSRDAEFLIVDEGPHASGSTFLAVAEALERAGVPQRSIALCASRVADPARLLAKSASERWPRYRSYAADTWSAGADEDLSAGAWRKADYGQDAAAWPACWTALERIKRRTSDGQWLDKFEGFSPYRDEAFERACVLAHAGYAPPPTWLGLGFVRYPWLGGRPARASDLDGQTLREIARYCAHRARAFRVNDVETMALERMVETNIDGVFGVDVGSRAKLIVERPIVPDARMQPFEWRLGIDGRLWKTDGHAHGDGALLPGPTDVGWDLAGAIVEWNMGAEERAQFLQDYSTLSGDRPEARLPGYLLAYCAQRLGETYIGACSSERQERARLRNAHACYRTLIERMLGVAPAQKPKPRARKPTRRYSRGLNAASA